MDAWCFASVTELARAIREREISCEALVRAHLERIERVNPKLNAVVQLAAERALSEARRADEGAERGEFRGPLHGVPMTIKDSIETAGVITTAGTPGLKGHVPWREDVALAVARHLETACGGFTPPPEPSART